jgi:hypothetical protein
MQRTRLYLIPILKCSNVLDEKKNKSSKSLLKNAAKFIFLLHFFIFEINKIDTTMSFTGLKHIHYKEAILSIHMGLSQYRRKVYLIR